MDKNQKASTSMPHQKLNNSLLSYIYILYPKFFQERTFQEVSHTKLNNGGTFTSLITKILISIDKSLIVI